MKRLIFTVIILTLVFSTGCFDKMKERKEQEREILDMIDEQS